MLFDKFARLKLDKYVYAYLIQCITKQSLFNHDNG